MKLFASLILIFNILTFNQLFSQNISFLNNYLGNVMIFDNGKIKQIEHLPLRSHKIGNIIMAYEDNAGNFKIYYNEFVNSISNFVSEYFVSDTYVVFRLNTQLKVFDHGTVKTLSVYSPKFSLGNDLILWFDDIEKRLKAYYDNKIYELDDALASGTYKEFTAVENIGAFHDNQGYFNVFFEGNIEKICFSNRLKSFSANRNIIAYIEEPVNAFRIFYFGEIIDLENFEPQSFKTGHDFVVYIDASNYLKIFYDFKTEIISFDKPIFYEAVDDLVVFAVQNYFKVYHKGNVYTLENYIPEEYKCNNNVLVYKDQMGYLKFFDGNKIETITYEKVTDFDLHGSLPKFKYGVNSESIYFNSKLYNND